MFAVIRTGGKQYRVAAEDVIRVDRVNGNPGEIVEFGEVLVVGGDTPQLGTPTVSGATVAGELLQHTRGDKVIAFKKRRRKNSRRKTVEDGSTAAQARAKAKGRGRNCSSRGSQIGQNQGQEAGQSGRKKAREGRYKEQEEVR